MRTAIVQSTPWIAIAVSELAIVGASTSAKIGTVVNSAYVAAAVSAPRLTEFITNLALDFAMAESNPGYVRPNPETLQAAGKAALYEAITVATGTGTRYAPMSVVRNIERGEKIANIVNEIKELTLTTHKEHALVKLASGKRAIIAGGEEGITRLSGQVTRIFGHSHPYHLAPTGPSSLDLSALESLGQRSSYLFEHGILSRFRSVGQPVEVPKKLYTR
jgi:hypothetical protein